MVCGGFTIFGLFIQQLCQFLRMVYKKVPVCQRFYLFLIAWLLFPAVLSAQNYNDSLLDGSWENNLPKVKNALLNKPDVNFRYADSISALHYACGNGNLEMVRVLVSAGANVNLRDTEQRTPLHVAALNGRDSIGEFLLVNGAFRESRNNLGQSPLFTAVANGQYIFADMCLYYGADIHARTADSSGICHMAVQARFPALLELLLSRGAVADVCNVSRNTPFMQAILNNDTACASVLRNYGAAIYAPCADSSDNALLRAAMNKQCNESIAYLLRLPEFGDRSKQKAIHDMAYKLDDKSLLDAVRFAHAPLSWKPVFRGLLVKPELTINFRDHSLGLSFGTMEMKSKIGFKTGISGRLWEKRVLFDYANTAEILQLQERRGFVYFGQYKAIRLLQKHNNGLQADVGIQELYTWARFDGMETKPWTGWLVVPTADITWFGQNYSLSFGCRYLDFRNDLPNVYFMFSGGWIIPFK